MTLLPGQYLRNITIQSIDPRRGAALFKAYGRTCCLFNHDVPDITLRPGVVIKKLVCVGKDIEFNWFRCALPGAFALLARELYSSTSFIRRDFRVAWVTRWKSIVFGDESLTYKRIHLDKDLGKPGCFWIGLVHAQWELPVCMDTLFEAMQGDLSFYPAPVEYVRGRSENNLFMGFPIIRDDAVAAELNIPGRIVLRYYPDFNKNAEEMPLDLRFCAPVVPGKWHFNLRKHCFPDKKTSFSATYWKSLFLEKGLEDIPGYSLRRKIFSGCKTNKYNTNCTRCGIEHFKQVHYSCRSFLHELVNYSVTFFKQRLTEQTGGVQIVLEEILDDIYRVQIILQKKVGSSDSSLKKSTYHTCVYRGVLYRDGEGGRNVMYLSPLTQYLTGTRKVLQLNKNVNWGIIYNVQKSD